MVAWRREVNGTVKKVDIEIFLFYTYVNSTVRNWSCFPNDTVSGFLVS